MLESVEWLPHTENMPSPVTKNMVNEHHTPMQPTSRSRRYHGQGDGVAGSPQLGNGHQNGKITAQPVDTKPQSEKDRGEEKTSLLPKSPHLVSQSNKWVSMTIRLNSTDRNSQQNTKTFTTINTYWWYGGSEKYPKWLIYIYKRVERKWLDFNTAIFSRLFAWESLQ